MDDDAKLEEVGELYGSGKMLTGEIKAELIKVRHSYQATPSRLC